MEWISELLQHLLDPLFDWLSGIPYGGVLLVIVAALAAALVWETLSDVLKESLKPWIQQHRWKLSISIILLLAALSLFNRGLVWAPLVLSVYAVALLVDRIAAAVLARRRTVRNLAILGLALLFAVICAGELRRATPMRVCVVLAVENNDLRNSDEIQTLWAKIDKVLSTALNRTTLTIRPRVVDNKTYDALSQGLERYLKNNGLDGALLVATRAEILGSEDNQSLKVIENLQRLTRHEQQTLAGPICHESDVKDAEYLSIVAASDIITVVSSLPGYQLTRDEQNRVRRRLLTLFSDFANFRTQQIKPDTLAAIHKVLASDEKEQIDPDDFNRLLNDYQPSDCGARSTPNGDNLRRTYGKKLALNRSAK